VAVAASFWEEEEQKVTITATQEITHRSIMAIAMVLRPQWGATPGFYAHNNQQTYFATELRR
jgi:hypothetical protein